MSAAIVQTVRTRVNRNSTPSPPLLCSPRMNWKPSLLLAAVWLTACGHRGARSVSGTIETDEVHVASRYGGRVERILAQEGDPLQPGQLIAELDARELSARRDQAAAQLEELERGPRPAEIAAAKAEWESLVAQADFARDDEK